MRTRETTNWPTGTRVRVTVSGWTGEVVQVTSTGSVRVRWDRTGETSRVSNPDMNLERE
jgi:hypothetical protein